MRRTERATGNAPRVLVVDDEPDIRELLELTLVKMGLGVVAVGSIAEAKDKLKGGERYDLCLTDMRLGDGEGLELVRHIGASAADLPVAVITAYGSAENAVAALKAGAFDYVSKPVGLDQLRSLVRSALSLPERGQPSERQRLIGDSPALRQARAMIAKLARTQAPVYISGESGSGKELAARLIHENGARRERPFVPVNCGAIPETLVESEFFGYRKGAFTGAAEDRDGFFQAANGGTLFLDEVADLPLAMQVKLLRAIQERRVRKVGETREEPVDVRIICATHQKLAALVAAGRFRQDLFYRINVIELAMPPLRECREDIPLFAEAMLTRLTPAGASKPRLTAAALAELSRYSFPGNIRELENILERALALSSSAEIDVGDLHLAQVDAVEAEGPEEEDGAPLPEYLDSLERKAILDALAKTEFNRTAAAKLLGITFRQLRYRMQRLGIKEE